jgi:hypothetical protein
VDACPPLAEVERRLRDAGGRLADSWVHHDATVVMTTRSIGLYFGQFRSRLFTCLEARVWPEVTWHCAVVWQIGNRCVIDLVWGGEGALSITEFGDILKHRLLDGCRERGRALLGVRAPCLAAPGLTIFLGLDGRVRRVGNGMAWFAAEGWPPRWEEW